MEKNTIKEEIAKVASRYSEALSKKIECRIAEMEKDDNAHYLIYEVLGITVSEGKLIDIYQNKGRFLYKYAGSFLEEVTLLCFQHKYPDCQKKLKIPNTIGNKPKTVEIDVVVNNVAFEIKWRDATTDGDHITKEHTKVQVIKKAGYQPVRIMFYYPNRDQAKAVQSTLTTIYAGVQGEYYSGDDAWHYVKKITGVDLKKILEEISLGNKK
jgi:hypothetical protein